MAKLVDAGRTRTCSLFDDVIVARTRFRRLEAAGEYRYRQW